GAKLDAIHALHLARHSSPDGGDRDRSLRALALARKYLSARSPSGGSAGTAGGSVVGPLGDQFLAEMTPAELEAFADHRVWPARFRDRLAPSRFATRDVRHHHGRQPPAQSSQDPVNSHAARHAGQEPRESMQPVDPAAVAPPRSAPPSEAASSSTTRDYI